MKRTHVAAIIALNACLLGVMLFSARAGSEDPGEQTPPPAPAVAEGTEGGPTQGILGIVQHARFVRLDRQQSRYTVPARLTTIQPWTAMSPEAQEVPLAAYEGRAIMVTGMDQGGWVYSAQIVDAAGPILTAVALRVFGPAAGANLVPPEEEPGSCE